MIIFLQLLTYFILHDVIIYMFIPKKYFIDNAGPHECFITRIWISQTLLSDTVVSTPYNDDDNENYPTDFIFNNYWPILC